MTETSRHVLVAGADRGAGEGICHVFRRKGWTVTARAVAVLGDPRELLDQTGAAHGPLRAVVGNQLGYDLAPGERADELDWQQDLQGALALSRAAAPRLAAAGGGAVVNVTFTSHFADPDDLAGLAAAKGAIVGATRGLALAHGRDGVRVVGVTPGFVLTPRLARHLAQMDSASRDAFLAGVRERTPLRRPGTPEDVGAMCAWVASERASFMTGVDVVLDGGALSLNRTFSYNPPAEPGARGLA